MDRNITYLLGAGASAKTIPVVANMHFRIQEVQHYLHEKLNWVRRADFDGPSLLRTNIESLMFVVKELEWLIAVSGDYHTIDTLAKKYYLTDSRDKENLRRLKMSLIIYFTVEQLLNIPSYYSMSSELVDINFNKEKLEKRYDSFIAAIANKSDDLISLNRHLKVLSWNYDIQFELSLRRFVDRLFHFVQDQYQIFPNKFLIGGKKIKLDMERFAMVKINGNAIWDVPMELLPHSEFEDCRTVFDNIDAHDSDDDLLSYFLHTFKHYLLPGLGQSKLTDPTKHFNFAWEVDSSFNGKYDQHSANLQTALEIASSTEILVVIGYSFPIFNREIDTKIFGAMKKLKKVYIQDIFPERIQSTMENAFGVFQEEKIVNLLGKEYKGGVVDPQYLRSVKKVDFQLTNSSGQFVIPFEMYQ